MNGDPSRYDKLESMLQGGSSEPHNVPLTYLRNITNNFSYERLLGEGGFGTVYKGVLQNGKEIAVKKLNSSTPGVKDRQFENEANRLMRLRHRNVVLLVGWCSETENIHVEYNGKYICAEKSERLLCLEYMPKGNLREHLSDEFSGLGWDTRYKIIEGICYGLRYLHEQWQPNAPIVHMDLKPANILLDNNMVPKIADFGLSRLFSEEKTWTCTKSRDGTLGYMSPEYIKRGLVSTKSDIFSLGVIIIEIVTGGRDYPDETGTSSHEFIETVLNNWTRRVENLFGDVSPEVNYQQIRRCIQIGLDCVKNDRFKRPTISQIIKTLHRPGSADFSNIKGGIPEQMDVSAPPLSSQPANTVQAAQPAEASVTSSGPNAILLNRFLQSLPNASANAGTGNFDVLRNNAQFRNLLGLVHANPQNWQPLLQELGKQNPQVMQLIQENQAEVLQLINEPLDGDEENEMNMLDQIADAAVTIAVSPEENEAILRLEGMGFDRAFVLEVFLVCNKNEQLASNFLLDHMHEFYSDDGLERPPL